MAKQRFFTIDDVTRIDLDKLVGWLPGGSSGWWFFRNKTRGEYVKAMLDSWDVLDRNGINTALRLAHFFGQGLIETGFLNYREENLNYSSDALQRTFSLYRRDPRLARQHHRKPELIANTVYGAHPSLGNTQPGDGWAYRGRGFIQLTGRDNYARYAQASGVDIVGDPDIISRDLKKSIEVAAAFWRANDLNVWADRDNGEAVSRGVNRGDPTSPNKAHSEAERIFWTNACFFVTEMPDRVRLARAQEDEKVIENPGEPVVTVLKVGDRSEAVRSLQEALLQLGYALGTPDGIFGNQTRRAVIAFQEEHGLGIDGKVGPQTQAAIVRERDDPRRAAADVAREERPDPFDLPPPVASELAGAPDPFR
ncbi:MAG: peptidoglycan-binding protein [Pseudomonadota bacterium]